jgi:hypothetical protein
MGTGHIIFFKNTKCIQTQPKDNECFAHCRTSKLELRILTGIELPTHPSVIDAAAK